MGPKEFADRLFKGEKFYDPLTGSIITIYGSPDITGEVVGMTEDGKMIKANAKNLEAYEGEKDSKSDTEKLNEMLEEIGVSIESEENNSEILCGVYDDQYMSGCHIVGALNEEFSDKKFINEVVLGNNKEAFGFRYLSQGEKINVYRGKEEILSELANEGKISSEWMEKLSDKSPDSRVLMTIGESGEYEPLMLLEESDFVVESEEKLWSTHEFITGEAKSGKKMPEIANALENYKGNKEQKFLEDYTTILKDFIGHYKEVGNRYQKKYDRIRKEEGNEKQENEQMLDSIYECQTEMLEKIVEVILKDEEYIEAHNGDGIVLTSSKRIAQEGNKEKSLELLDEEFLDIDHKVRQKLNYINGILSRRKEQQVGADKSKLTPSSIEDATAGVVTTPDFKKATSGIKSAVRGEQQEVNKDETGITQAGE